MRNRHLYQIIFFVCIASTILLIGVYLGLSQRFPTQIIQTLRAAIKPVDKFEYKGFGLPLYPGSKLFEPTLTPEAIAEAIAPYIVHRSAIIAPDQIQHLSNQRVGDDLWRVDFSFAGTHHSGYVYGPSELRPDLRHCYVILIMGSGSNRAYAMRRGDPRDVHNGGGPIYDDLAQRCDVFIPERLNQGYLSIHNGKQRAGFSVIAEMVARNGGNRSDIAHFFSTVYALKKYLDTQYKYSVIAGLSAGAEATIAISAQQRFDISLAASGVSTYVRSMPGHDESNLVLIYFGDVVFFGSLRDLAKNTDTNFIYSFGTKDTSEMLALDAANRHTCKSFVDIKNVTCIIHNGGHWFPNSHLVKIIGNLIDTRR